jgi:hypothetical protein
MTSLDETTARFLGRRRRPAATGRKPVRPDRLLTDPERRIFREEVRGLGGVVVFDCSGSMGVNHEVVRETVAKFAGATVLAYSTIMGSTGRDKANAYILARNGRMISARDMAELPLHSGNGCDGPALRYAAQLRRSPRDFVLWVSDFGVTGVGDSQTYDHMTECAEICRRHRIVQVDDCVEALEVLEEMKRRGTAPRRYWTNASMRNIIERIEAGQLDPAVCRVRYAN